MRHNDRYSCSLATLRRICREAGVGIPYLGELRRPELVRSIERWEESHGRPGYVAAKLGDAILSGSAD
jgi:hypothetical protein